VACAALFFWQAVNLLKMPLLRIRESDMKKFIFIIWLFLTVIAISACAGAPAKKGNTQEQQRSHSRDAQDELSSEIKR